MKNKLSLIGQHTTILTTALSLLFLFACHANNSGHSQKITDSLNNELLSLHEKAMDKIGILRVLKDSLNKADSASGKLSHQPAIEKLSNADSAMFAWMQKESSDTVKRTDSETILHLKAALLHVSAINRQMDSAINEARSR